MRARSRITIECSDNELSHIALVIEFHFNWNYIFGVVHFNSDQRTHRNSKPHRNDSEIKRIKFDELNSIPHFGRELVTNFNAISVENYDKHRDRIRTAVVQKERQLNEIETEKKPIFLIPIVLTSSRYFALVIHTIIIKSDFYLND